SYWMMGAGNLSGTIFGYEVAKADWNGTNYLIKPGSIHTIDVASTTATAFTVPAGYHFKLLDISGLFNGFVHLGETTTTRLAYFGSTDSPVKMLNGHPILLKEGSTIYHRYAVAQGALIGQLIPV